MIKPLNLSDDISNTNTKENKSKIGVTTLSISTQIYELIRFSSSINYETDEYKKMENDLVIYFTRLLNGGKEYGLLKSYFEGGKLKNQKIVSKMQKNIMIYAPLIIENIYPLKEILNEKDFINKIKEAIKKMIIILFIYGDKTSLSLVSKMMKLDISELREMENSFIIIQKKLQSKEDEILDIIISRDSSYVNTSFFKNDVFTRTFRSIVEKTDEKYVAGGEKTRDHLLQETAVKEIEIATQAFYNLFLKTIELNANFEFRLNKLGNAFINLFGMLKIFKELKIINLDYCIRKIKKFDNKFFKIFLEGIGDNHFNLDKLYEELNSENDIKKSKVGKNNDNLDLDDIKLQGINSDVWMKLKTNDKYVFFFNKVLGLNSGVIKLSNSLMLKHLSIKTLISKFCEVSSYNKEQVIAKLDFFKSKKSFILTDFINNNLDYLIFLYEWWEFIITKGVLNNDKPNFLKDIIHDLKEKGEIRNDMEIKTDGELYNLSAVNIALQINFILNDLSRGNIQISKYRIGKISFKDTTKLYSKNEKSSSAESILYINNAIDACINVLNGKKLLGEQGEYVKYLQDIEILPKDLAKLRLSDRDKIIKLIPALKIVKIKIQTLIEMQNISKNDMEQVSSIFSEIGLNTNSYDTRIGNTIGPEKDFGRIIVKLFKSYNGDFHKIGDLNRFRLVGKLNTNDSGSLTQIIKEVANLRDVKGVLNISFENSAGHLLSNPEKKSAYRDIKANILLSSGNVVELQIHFDEMIGVKGGNVILTSHIKEMLEKNNSLLTSDEVNNFISLYIELFGRKPSRELILNISTLNEGQLDKTKIGNGNINCDNLYKVTRSLDDSDPIKYKLITLERILFNTQWSEVVIKNLEKNGLKIKA
ncbi:MAG: hypothetical protein PHV23_04635 [Candidatus Gracilibacteria bacterium]|nr:hypothetical protein [Candidatus Gracilibacteria bacterium]